MESPIPRRLSTSISIPAEPSGNSSRLYDIENVINSYEAEEERIVNVLSRKLEQVSFCPSSRSPSSALTQPPN